MNNAKEIQKTLNDVREQLLELEKDIQSSQQIAFSQHNEKEIRKRLDTVREQVLKLENEIQHRQKTASNQQAVSQTAFQPGLSFTAEQIALVSAVVQQASNRIHDLRQLSAIEYSDTQIEAASHSFIHQGWKSYLDATKAILQLGNGSEDS